MKKLILLISLLSVVVLSVSAQRSAHNKVKYVEWVDKPVIHPLPPEFANEHAIILFNDISLDFRKEGLDIKEGKGVNMYTTIHRLIKVIDDQGIDEFNTADIPINPGTRVPLIRARTILPNGKVQEIVKDMIKVVKNQSGNWSVIIAMEGVEKNAEIELLIKEILPADYSGSEIFQYSIPVMSSHFSMSYPKELVFQEKGFNGFPDAKDTIIDKRRHIDITVNDIPKLLPEPYSFYDLRLMRMEYRLDHYDIFNENNRQRQYTYNDLGRKIFDRYYKITEKERAAVNKYLSELGVRPNGDELENLEKIEKGIKTGIMEYAYVDYDERKQVFATQTERSISLYDVNYDETKDVLDTIISKRAASPSGIIKLFAACFVQSGINHQLGMAGDHRETKFDNTFENWNNLEYSLFYFPDFKKYMEPTNPYYRYPMVPYEVLNTKGVFCNIPPNGIPTGTLSEIRTIPALSAYENHHGLAVAVSFTKDMDAQIDISHSYTGYLSAGLRESLAMLTKEKQNDLIKKILTIADKPEDIVKYTISNEGFDNYYDNKPLEITATVNTSSLTDFAGKNYLFKVGEIIGRQPSLYAEDDRKLPVDLDCPNSYTRTITLNLPPGYKVLNPEVVRLHADYVNRNVTPVIGFSSDYTLIPDKKNGDKMVITINEFYKQLHFSPEDYERFRKVVNASSDFYKVALLITNTKKEKESERREHSLTKK